MEIQHIAHSSFKLKTGVATVILDPFTSDHPNLKLKFPKIDADIVTVSHDHHDHNGIEGVSGNPFVIHGPGEYEIKGVHVFGFQTYHDEKKGEERGRNTVFAIEAEGLTLVHLGDLGHLLENKLVEDLGDVDVLMIPVGGTYTIDAAKATDVVRQIEPKIVIPMHYKNPVSDLTLDPVENFCKEMGVEAPEHLDKLKITKDKLPEDTKVVILEMSV
jgi:L-ascorbate metabolism protein UlaG (beta-lactamase superfamily)